MSRLPRLDPKRWQRLCELFDGLAEEPPGVRAARLDEITADDPQIGRALARLMAADAHGPDLLEEPVAARGADGTADDTAVDDLAEPAPARAGAYRITGPLGRGGMADVYAAERDDGLFEQRVAVKVLRRGLDTDDLLARFLRERRILARLAHPAIARLLDGGALADGRPYLVMERVDGRPIDRWAEEQELGVEGRLRLLIVACDAVAFAHRNLIVHRDLKPSNVLVSDAGEVKLLDFGIAKLLEPEGEAPRTSRERQVLTPAYAAPEQLAGEATTTATDVWGLGALAFALLVGEPPRAAELDADPSRVEPGRASSRVRSRGQAALDPRVRASVRHRAARLAGDLDTILAKALALDPARRYASAESLAEDLRRFLAGQPIGARPASLAYRARKLFGRHRVAAAAGAFAALSLVAGGAIAAWQARVAARERARPLPVVRSLTYSGRDSAPAASPDGRVVAFSSTRDGRRRIWLADVESGHEAPRTEGEDDAPRISPDGRRLLFSRRDGERRSLYEMALAGGPPRALVDDALAGDYAPDGRRIVVLRQRQEPDGVVSVLVTAAAGGGDERELTRFAGRSLVPPRWSPDGRTIATARTALQAGQGTEILLVDVASGRLRVLAPRGDSPLGLAWAGSGRLVYAQPDSVLGWTTGSSSRVILHDLSDAVGRVVLTSPTRVGAIDVAGPGRLVFETGASRVNLREIELAPGGVAEDRKWLTRGDSADRQPRSARDGEWIVYSSNRGGNLDLWAVSRRTAAVRRLTDDPALDWDPSFAADGRLLWSTNRAGHFEIWSAGDDGSGATQVTNDGVDAENPSASPDGAWIVYVSGNPRSRGLMRSRADGSDAALLVAGDVVLPEISPDGRHVAFVENLGGARSALRFARLADGQLLSFRIALSAWVPAADPDVGRCRWFPDGRSLALIDREEDGTYAVFHHRFAPESEGPAGPGRLLARDPDFSAETLDISPDGSRLTVGFWDRASNLMLAHEVVDVGR